MAQIIPDPLLTTVCFIACHLSKYDKVWTKNFNFADLNIENLSISTATCALPCGGRKASPRISLQCSLYFLAL